MRTVEEDDSAFSVMFHNAKKINKKHWAGARGEKPSNVYTHHTFKASNGNMEGHKGGICLFGFGL